MAVHGSDLVRVTLNMFNSTHPYYSQVEPRNDPPWTHHCDCSGLCCWAMNAAGIPYGESNSWAMAQQGHQLGLGMSIRDAFNTPGAWLIQGANEGQTDINSHGHIVISAGDGVHTLEARGHTAGCGVFYGASLWWDYAMMPPGVLKGSAPPPVPPPAPNNNMEEMMPVWMPSTNQTPVGVVASARCVASLNMILLEGGARLLGDLPVKDDKGNYVPGKHYWTPPKSAAIPGWQCVGMIDLRMNTQHESSLALLMEFPNGNSGTYKTTILSGHV